MSSDRTHHLRTRPQTVRLYHNSAFTDGDFTLISTDNVEFKVPSHHLFAASGVFRDAPTDGPMRVQFTDSEIEYSEVLSLFLHLILHGHLQHNNGAAVTITDAVRNRWADLITFLQKWDCSGPLRTFGLCVTELLLHGRISPLHALILGILADDVELCISAFKVKNKLERPLGAIDVLFPVWQRVKPKYVFALAGASERMRHVEGCTEISEVFRHYLLEAERAVDSSQAIFPAEVPATAHVRPLFSRPSSSL